MIFKKLNKRLNNKMIDIENKYKFFKIMLLINYLFVELAKNKKRLKAALQKNHLC
jgi:hypothetical protein